MDCVVQEIPSEVILRAKHGLIMVLGRAYLTGSEELTTSLWRLKRFHQIELRAREDSVTVAINLVNYQQLSGQYMTLCSSVPWLSHRIHCLYHSLSLKYFIQYMTASRIVIIPALALLIYVFFINPKQYVERTEGFSHRPHAIDSVPDPYLFLLWEAALVG